MVIVESRFVFGGFFGFFVKGVGEYGLWGGRGDREFFGRYQFLIRIFQYLYWFNISQGGCCIGMWIQIYCFSLVLFDYSIGFEVFIVGSVVGESCDGDVGDGYNDGGVGDGGGDNRDDGDNGGGDDNDNS